jgi:hypothetical protein
MEANKKNVFGNSTTVEINDNGVQPLSKVADLQKQVEEVKTVSEIVEFPPISQPSQRKLKRKAFSLIHFTSLFEGHLKQSIYQSISKTFKLLISINLISNVIFR